MQATKIFKFSYAHILPDHKGGCSRIHGHNVQLEVTAQRYQSVDRPGQSDDGMVIDFTELKEIVNREIVDVLDHRFIAKGDEWPVEVIRLMDKGVFELPGYSAENLEGQVAMVGVRTTAENLAKWVFAKLHVATLSDRRFEIVKVVWWETDTGKAEYTIEDYAEDN